MTKDNTSKLPIVFFLQDFDEGGVQRVSLKLINELSTLYKITLVVMKGNGELTGFLNENVDVIRFKNRKVVTSLIDIILLLSRLPRSNIISAIVQVNIAIAISNALLLFKHHHIATEHTLSTLASRHAQRMNLKVSYVLQRIFYRFASKVVCVSDGIYKDLISRVPEIKSRSSIIRNPVIDREFAINANAPITASVQHFIKDKKVVLGVGRLVEMKDFKLLIDSFAETFKQENNVVLLIIGDGPERDNLLMHVNHKGISSAVMFMGHLGNPLPYFKIADVFVLTSKYEGFGLVLVEALALSKSVVSVDCECGPREVISGVGELIKIRCPQAISAAILKNLKKDTDKQAMINRASLYSTESVVVDYLKIFT